MSGRNYDWSPLNCSSDPVPGYPDVLDQYLQVFRTTSQAAEHAHSDLLRISTDQLKAKDLDDLRPRVTELSATMLNVKTIYDAATRALEVYAPVLRDAQSRSLSLLRQAEGPAHQERSDGGQSRGMYRQLLFTPAGPEREQLQADYEQLEQRRVRNLEAIRTAQESLRGVCESRDEAAEYADSHLKGALEHSPLKDTWWDAVKDCWTAFDQWLQDNSELFEFLGDMLGKISLCLTILAFFFPPLGVVAGVVGIAAGIASLMGAWGKARKTGNWGTFAVEAVFAALSIFSGFKAIGASVKAARTAGLAAKSGQQITAAQRAMRSDVMKAWRNRDLLGQGNAFTRMGRFYKVMVSGGTATVYNDLKHLFPRMAARSTAALAQTIKEVAEHTIEHEAKDRLKESSRLVPSMLRRPAHVCYAQVGSGE